MKNALALLALVACAGAASAQTLTLAGPGPQTFANGGGSGFGGTLGSGSITMEVVNSGADLRITFVPGNNVNDYVAIYLDTRAGGFTDAQMDDSADGGRRVISNLTRDSDDTFPILPDFGFAFWSGTQTVGFELTAGNTPGHLNYFAGSYSNAGWVQTISLAALGNPTQIDWFAAYTSDSNYNSDESLPNSNIAGGNPGFGAAGSTVAYTSFNRYLIPTPGAAALLGLGGLALGRRRR
ncbi:MAG: hypothetical protein ACK51T_07255 [bacterium]